MVSFASFPFGFLLGVSFTISYFATVEQLSGIPHYPVLLVIVYLLGAISYCLWDNCLELLIAHIEMCSIPRYCPYCQARCRKYEEQTDLREHDDE